MSVTASLRAIVANGLCNDVIFTIADGFGGTYGPFVESRPQTENTSTFLSSIGPTFSASLIAAEIANDIGQITTLGLLANPTAKFATVVEIVIALRAAYAEATQTQTIMIGDYLSSLTDVQLEAAFGLTSAQVSTLRANKLTPASQAAATIRATTGA